MKHISFNYDKILDFVTQEQILSYKDNLEKHNTALREKTGKGNEFLGWVDLPSSISEEHLEEIEATAKMLRSKKLEFLVVIGIGGSFLGTKAVIDCLSNSFALLKESENPIVLYAGHNIGEDYIYELRQLLKSKDYAICVISKSGTTLEPAIAFRLLRSDIEEKYGLEEARERIIAVTDASHGALRTLAKAERYKTFTIPEDVGGRYSVLTPVGLVPIAIAGFDIRALVQGARDMEATCGADIPFEKNLPAQYAAARNALYSIGKKIEILVNYNSKLHFVAEWWKQLFGESEGKDGKGIFPVIVDFTSDLSSMGQYIQKGERILYETVISVASPDYEVAIPEDPANLDELNFLAEKRFDDVNKMAEKGTILAHVDGGVPNLHIDLPKLDAYYLGQLFYFFEFACGLSGYILDVNPFDQPGVEEYKHNMLALLDKPGFEKERNEIREKLSDTDS